MKCSFTQLSLIKCIVLGLCAFLVIPYIHMLVLSAAPANRYVRFLFGRGIIYRYLWNTTELIIKVGLFSSAIGFMGAYLMVLYDFPVKRLINLLFILPLSIPIYVGAYVYSDLYQLYPALSSLLKNDFTMNSAVCIYTLFLYPYVYLMTSSYLKRHMQEYREVGQSLGLSQGQILLRIVLPLSRRVLFASSLFVMYESLSDFAVAEYYGTQTLAKALNDAWRVSSDQGASAKLALMLLLLVSFIVWAEKLFKPRSRMHADRIMPVRVVRAGGAKLCAMYIFFAIIIMFAFVLPASRVLQGAWLNASYFSERNLMLTSFKTIALGFIVLALIITGAMFLSSMTKYLGPRSKYLVSLIGGLGYMTPSLVLGLGLYSFCFALDVKMLPLFAVFGSKGYIITGTALLLVLGLVIKFFALAMRSYEQVYTKLKPELFEVSLSLGRSPLASFWDIDRYYLQKASKVIIILVLLDVLKELTLAFTLSPFNFRTISMEIYYYIANEMQDVSYVPSAIIIGLCVFCILILERVLKHEAND